MANIIIEPHLTKIHDFLLIMIEKLLNLVQRQCKQVVEGPVCNLVTSLLNMIYVYLNKENIQLDNEEKFPTPEKTVFTYLTFCLVWSLGANLHDSSRPMFNEFLKTNGRPFKKKCFFLKKCFPLLSKGNPFS